MKNKGIRIYQPTIRIQLTQHGNSHLETTTTDDTGATKQMNINHAIKGEVQSGVDHSAEPV